VVTLEECHFIDVYRIDVKMICDRFHSYCTFLHEYVKMVAAFSISQFYTVLLVVCYTWG